MAPRSEFRICHSTVKDKGGTGQMNKSGSIVYGENDEIGRYQITVVGGVGFLMRSDQMNMTQPYRTHIT